MRRLPGSHPANIKNRSSKHLSWLCGCKLAVRSASNETLAFWAQGDKNGKYKSQEALDEIARRNKLRNKKDAKTNG